MTVCMGGRSRSTAVRYLLDVELASSGQPCSVATIDRRTLSLAKENHAAEMNGPFWTAVAANLDPRVPTQDSVGKQSPLAKL